MDMLSAAQRSVVPTTFIPLVWTHAHPLVVISGPFIKNLLHNHFITEIFFKKNPAM